MSPRAPRIYVTETTRRVYHLSERVMKWALRNIKLSTVAYSGRKVDPPPSGCKNWPKYQTVQEEGQLQNFDCALGMIVWEDLHRTGIRPDPYCMLSSLHETMDRNHLGRCIASSSGTECERYWEARTKMMENWLLPCYLCEYSLLGALCLFWMFFLLLSVVFIFFSLMAGTLIIYHWLMRPIKTEY